MKVLVIIIVIAIICIQFFFFLKNWKRMKEFGTIFTNPGSWRLSRDQVTGIVNGISGSGNSIFSSIVTSINKYLGNNAGSVIDFGLLKDSIDRHCDSVENDISTQTPIPLYWGLAGTMAGVILGLFDLLSSDAIGELMGRSGGQIDVSAESATQGIEALLSGVAWAMGASICGIILTTLNSLFFKKRKLAEEEGKNSFLAWMQSVLLPELPSDTSQALNQLVVNLNKFNETFSENTSKLGNALKAVNESYAIQANVIQAVHDMDLMKMAQANVKVLRQLQECTDKLEGFNEYLNAVEGYTEAIYRFQTMFDNEADRLHVLEEIRDFFQRHKAEIAKTAGSADLALQSSLTQLRENASSNVAELHNRLAEQSEEFKRILNQEKEGFEELMSRVNAQFADQMQKMPAMARQLEQISSIPDHLESLVRKIEQSNAQMASQLSQAVKAASRPSVLPMGGGFSGGGSSTPAWMKWTAIVALVIIAAWCVGNAIGSIFSGNGHAEPELVDTETVTIVEPAAEVPAETEKMDAPAAPEVKVDSSATAPAQPAL